MQPKEVRDEMAIYYMGRRGKKKRMPEACLCGAPDCRQCYPLSWFTNIQEDRELAELWEKEEPDEDANKDEGEMK